MNEESNVSSHIYGGLATIMRLLVVASIAVGILLLARIILLFFESLKTVPGYEQVVAITGSFIGPLKSVAPVKTPYEGIFDIAATGALLVALVLEFVFQSVQNYLEKQSVRAGTARPAGTSTAASGMPKIEDDLVKK
ncbi:MAG: hypothetical protein Q8L35_09080 [Actinomycetota bacterium]|nr:hypothetical protein [Actinomycetota bacterium]